MDRLAYNEVRKEIRDPLQLRVALVRYAQAHGIKPAARVFGTSPQTVRLWLRRYQEEGLSGLKGRSRRPRRRHPQATPRWVEERIIALRTAQPGLGQDRIARLLREEDVVISGKTVGKILRRHGLIATKPNGRKQQGEARRRQGRPAPRAPFAEVQLGLSDLAELASCQEAVELGLLPRFELALRDLATGAGFVAYARELDAHSVRCFFQKVLWHLEPFDFDIEQVYLEEGGEWMRRHLDRHLVDLWQQHGISPRLVADGSSFGPWHVKSFQTAIEVELFDDELPLPEEAFYRKAFAVTCRFNLQRSSGRSKRSPLERARSADPTLPSAVMAFEPICLDDCAC